MIKEKEIKTEKKSPEKASQQITKKQTTAKVDKKGKVESGTIKKKTIGQISNVNDIDKIINTPAKTAKPKKINNTEKTANKSDNSTKKEKNINTDLSLIPTQPNKGIINKIGQRIREIKNKKQNPDRVKKEYKTRTVVLYKLYIYILIIGISLFILISALLIKTPFLSNFNFPKFGGYVSLDLIIDNIKVLDSLKGQIEMWKHYNKNISDIIAGEKPTLTMDSITYLRNIEIDEKSMTGSSYEEILKERVMNDRKFEVKDYLHQFNFFPPLMGTIEVPFSKNNNSITLVVHEHSAVLSISNGTVISSYWDPNNGYVMLIKHSDDIISTYGLLTKRVREVGERVLAGEVIGYIGNSETPISEIANINKTYRLDFALWHKGNRVNPANYIVF